MKGRCMKGRKSSLRGHTLVNKEQTQLFASLLMIKRVGLVVGVRFTYVVRRCATASCRADSRWTKTLPQNCGRQHSAHGRVRERVRLS